MKSETLVFLLLCCLAAMSLVLFALMGVDKRRAQMGGRRVRERTLFLLAFLGGALGGIVGMRAFRHKTKHASFAVGMLFLFLLNLACAFFSLWLNART